jgi:hypothetical protein
MKIGAWLDTGTNIAQEGALHVSHGQTFATMNAERFMFPLYVRRTQTLGSVVQNRTAPLIRGEHELGSYQLQIARHTSSGWAATVPPLYAIVTNCRLIIWPQTRKPYPPASIPRNYITSVDEVELGHRKGILLAIKTGHCWYMMASSSDVQRLTDNMRQMLTPPLRGRVYTPRLDRGNLARLIEFIERL